MGRREIGKEEEREQGSKEKKGVEELQILTKCNHDVIIMMM